MSSSRAQVQLIALAGGFHTWHCFHLSRVATVTSLVQSGTRSHFTASLELQSRADIECLNCSILLGNA